jgi:hypothetical protein
MYKLGCMSVDPLQFWPGRLGGSKFVRGKVRFIGNCEEQKGRFEKCFEEGRFCHKFLVFFEKSLGKEKTKKILQICHNL